MQDTEIICAITMSHMRQFWVRICCSHWKEFKLHLNGIVSGNAAFLSC